MTAVSRIITDGAGHVLDVGRLTRTVPAPMERPSSARPALPRPRSDRPPGMCEAHHIRHWADGGPTDLENLVMLCRLCTENNTSKTPRPAPDNGEVPS